MTDWVDALVAQAELPLARAVRAGVEADRLGPAFLVGYRAALQALVPRLGPPLAPALCATEEGPVHPARIATQLVADGDGWRLRGHKRWVTGAPGADTLVVLATAGTRDGRADLRGVVVSTAAPGVRVEARGPTPFVPEVPHAEVHLEDVRVEAGDVLPGDGWTDLVRPFRTVEDVHVLAAVHGYLLGAAGRAELGRDVVCGLLEGVATLAGLAAADPSAPGTHLALAGLLGSLSARVADLTLPGEEGERWERDRLLLDVARKAREARLHRAWG